MRIYYTEGVLDFANGILMLLNMTDEFVTDEVIFTRIVLLIIAQRPCMVT